MSLWVVRRRMWLSVAKDIALHVLDMLERVRDQCFVLLVLFGDPVNQDGQRGVKAPELLGQLEIPPLQEDH